MAKLWMILVLRLNPTELSLWLRKFKWVTGTATNAQRQTKPLRSGRNSNPTRTTQAPQSQVLSESKVKEICAQPAGWYGCLFWFRFLCVCLFFNVQISLLPCGLSWEFALKLPFCAPSSSSTKRSATRPSLMRVIPTKAPSSKYPLCLYNSLSFKVQARPDPF